MKYPNSIWIVEISKRNITYFLVILSTVGLGISLFGVFKF